MEVEIDKTCTLMLTQLLETIIISHLGKNQINKAFKNTNIIINNRLKHIQDLQKHVHNEIDNVIK